MVIQIAAIAVIRVGRKALLPCVNRKPLFRKLPVGLSRVVLGSVRKGYLRGLGTKLFDNGPFYRSFALVFFRCFQDFVPQAILLQVVDVSLSVHRLQLSRIGFPLLLELTVFGTVGIDDVMGCAPDFVGCHDSHPFLMSIRKALLAHSATCQRIPCESAGIAFPIA